MPLPALRRDDRGAILLMGVFVGPFLIGLVYYAFSCSMAMLHREGLQQAADASAFSAAVLSARAMNAIAVMNVLMMCITSLLLPVRALLPAYATVAAMGCDDACSCARVANAAAAYAVLSQRSAAMESRARSLLTALSDAQAALAREVPRMGQLASDRSAARNLEFVASASTDLYSPSLSPARCRLGLPVEDDSFREVCRRARPYVWELALRIAGPRPLNTIGPCMSGGMALGLAASDLSNPEGSVCREAATPPCSGGGPHLKKVFEAAENGNDYMQYWARLRGKDRDPWRRSVELGSRDQRVRATPPELNVGFAQAELFYDCAGPWASIACNGQENAMWNTRWTARLRRVHPPTISFAGDAVVKNQLANASYWNQRRAPLMRARRDPLSGASTEAASTLRSSEEGPLQ